MPVLNKSTDQHRPTFASSNAQCSGRQSPPVGRAGKGREGSRVLSNAATDVLHEGAEAQGGGLGTRRLAAGEGLPGGRHRLGEHANSSSCLAPSGLRFCGDPPTILRARSAFYASGAPRCLPGDASRPEARVRFECQFEFPCFALYVRRRELSRAVITINENSRRRPHACAAAEPRTMPVKSRSCAPCGASLAGREGPLDLPLGVLDKGDSPRAPLRNPGSLAGRQPRPGNL